MCRIFCFKGCTILAFMVLQKPDVWKKHGSQVKCEKAPEQVDCRMFEYLLTMR